MKLIMLLLPISLLLLVISIGNINTNRAYREYKISTINQEHKQWIADITLEAYRQCLSIVYKYYDYKGECEYIWKESYESLNTSYTSLNENDKRFIYTLALGEPSTLDDLKAGMVMLCNNKQSNEFEKKKNDCEEKYLT